MDQVVVQTMDQVVHQVVDDQVVDQAGLDALQSGHNEQQNTLKPETKPEHSGYTPFQIYLLSQLKKC